MRTGVLCTALVSAVMFALLGACSSDPDPQDSTGSTGDHGSNSPGSTAPIESIRIEPADPSVVVERGTPARLELKAIARRQDGTEGPVQASWTVDRGDLGTLDDTGVFNATGALGGVAKLRASYTGVLANASLTVKLHVGEVRDNVAPASQAALKSASQRDPSANLAYPYDGTVFPRGLGGPELMWNGGSAGDSIYVHVTSPTFELESFAVATPNSRYAFSDGLWATLTDSISGPATVQVARATPSGATLIASHTWTVAPASIRGAIYYWANNLGRIMRIQPGAKAPDDFANKAPLNDTTKYPQSSCLMTCHTVSANGQVLASGGGSFGGSYDLSTAAPRYSLGGVWKDGQTDWQNIQWALPALSPDGAYLLVNSLASTLSSKVSGPATFEGLYDTATGKLVEGSGLGGRHAMPAFSPTGSHIVYVDAGPAASATAGWDEIAPGPLMVVDFDRSKTPMASNPRQLISPGSDPSKAVIAWPSVSPDGKWVVYHRGNTTRTTVAEGSRAELYLTSATNAGPETRLAALDGDASSLPGGARDTLYNFEPTFAPLSYGGYFWVVFSSRRTFGNALTGAPEQVKLLWIAAIDQNPQPGKDPSHAAFVLPGQDLTSLNMRGFWALESCRAEGQGCSGGAVECCGGLTCTNQICQRPPR